LTCLIAVTQTAVDTRAVVFKELSVFVGVVGLDGTLIIRDSVFGGGDILAVISRSGAVRGNDLDRGIVLAGCLIDLGSEIIVYSMANGDAGNGTAVATDTTVLRRRT
jgi:hypothetical protein